MAGEGDPDCSKSEGEDISDETECRKAASALGLDFSNKTSANYPKRCYHQMDSLGDLGVYWNNDNVGGTLCGTMCSPICKIEGINILSKIDLNIIHPYYIKISNKLIVFEQIE